MNVLLEEQCGAGVAREPDMKLQEMCRALGDMRRWRCVRLCRGSPGSHGRFWSQRKRETWLVHCKRGRIPTLHAENENRPSLSQSLSFPILGRVPPEIHRGYTLLETRAAGPVSALACPPPPTILLQSSCGNREWGRRLGGAPGAAFLCMTAHVGPLGAECSSGSLVTQPRSLPPAAACRGTEGRQPSSSLPPSRAGDPQPAGASPEHPLQEDPSPSSAPDLSEAFQGLKKVAKLFACGPSKTRRPP